ncbi:MAG: glycosyltransferase family 39 protein [Dehalococcoidia bacterium]
MRTLSRAWAATTEGVRELPRWLVYALSGLALLLVLGLPTLIIPFATDQVWFALGARTILDGDQLYRDFWDQKSPLIYLLYAVPFALAGEHMEAVRVMDLINVAIAMAGVFFLGRRYFSERAGVFAAAIYAFAYLAWTAPADLGETESFMAAPLAFAFFLYPRSGDGGRVALRAFSAGALLGVAFALKTTAVLFVLGLPAAELLWRAEGWTLRGRARRLAITAAGFLVVPVALLAYMAGGGVLDDFIDVQRNYTGPYNAFRWGGAEGSHARFLLVSTAAWTRDVAFIVVPAGAALFFAAYRPAKARGAFLLALLALLALGGVWWQGKMFHYHWLATLPPLALLAGYAIDESVSLFQPLPRAQAWGAAALLAGGLAVLAFQPLLDTYDDYRALGSYADGSLSRRDVEAHYYPLYAPNHEIVDYARERGDDDDLLFVWGVWPQTYFWLDRPLVSPFIVNSGLRATWSPQSWRDELMEDLEATPPRFFAVARGDNQPWLTGTTQTSDEYLRDDFPALSGFIEDGYTPVLDNGLFLLYERTDTLDR